MYTMLVYYVCVGYNAATQKGTQLIQIGEVEGTHIPLAIPTTIFVINQPITLDKHVSQYEIKNYHLTICKCVVSSVDIVAVVHGQHHSQVIPRFYLTVVGEKLADGLLHHRQKMMDVVVNTVL